MPSRNREGVFLFCERTVRETDRHFIEMKDTDTCIDSNANMLVVTRDADLTADMQTHRTTGDLFERRMRGTCNGTCSDMIFVDEALSLCGNDGTLDDLLHDIEIPTAEINGRRADTERRQARTFGLLVFARARECHLHRGTTYINTRIFHRHRLTSCHADGGFRNRRDEGPICLQVPSHP